jgi:O-antigen ligase
MGVYKYFFKVLLLMFLYMLSVYQTPVTDISSVLDIEYLSIAIKYLFGPSVLVIVSLFDWKNIRNQRRFTSLLILLNIILIFSQLSQGIITGAVLGELHSNHMAAVAVTSIAILFSFKANSSDLNYRAKFLFYISIVCLLMSLSRGTFLALATSFLAFIILKKYSSKKFVFLSFITLISINVFVSSEFNRVLDSELGQSLSSKLENISGKDVKENGRVKLWSEAITSWSGSPYTGVGVYARRSWDRELSDGTVHTLSIHNYYLAILLEAGILGLTTVGIMLALLINLVRGRNRNLTNVAVAFIVGVLIHQITEVSLTTGSLMVGFLMWFTVGLCINLNNDEIK